MLPNDRKYIATHEWIKPDGDLFLVGITDYAQGELGDVVYVGDFKVGAQLQAGDVAGVVESVKTASDIYAPISGEVVAFNDVLSASPELINEGAYEHWIFKIRASDPNAFDNLLDGSAYEQTLS